MFKIFLIITILTLSCFGKEIKTIDFSGDIDLVLGDFSKSNLEKVCDISYPTIYKFWKEKPTFTQNDIKICSDLLKDYFDSFGFYRALISYEIVEDKTIFNIKKDEQIKISSIKIEDEYKNIIDLKVNDGFKASNFTNSKKIYTNIWVKKVMQKVFLMQKLMLI